MAMGWPRIKGGLASEQAWEHRGLSRVTARPTGKITEHQPCRVHPPLLVTAGHHNSSRYCWGWTWPLWLEQLPGGPADTGPHPSASVLLPDLSQLWVLTKSREPPNGQG